MKNRIKPIKKWTQEYTRVINGRLIIYWRQWLEPQRVWFSKIPKWDDDNEKD